jgi:hypothetical protein
MRDPLRHCSYGFLHLSVGAGLLSSSAAANACLARWPVCHLRLLLLRITDSATITSARSTVHPNRDTHLQHHLPCMSATYAGSQYRSAPAEPLRHAKLVFRGCTSAHLIPAPSAHPNNNLHQSEYPLATSLETTLIAALVGAR